MTRAERTPLGIAVGLASAALVMAGCATSSSSSWSAGPGVVRVVAAENVWGSIAAQIGGRHARVTSIVTKPDTDPHSYEPTANDAKAVAGAQFVIENGVGYDPWVPKLLAADTSHPTVLDVGAVLHLPGGANPHRWYNPGDIQAVITAIVADYQRLDPADAAYFTQQQTAFDTVALARYDATIAAIKAKYAGTPVGASESIFAMLAPALGLDLVTPASFLTAISEGTDVSAADKRTIDEQIRTHRIKIYVYNRQNVTPDVQAQLAEVNAEKIPEATITETLAPATATYQAWQTAQLLGIQSALAAADTGG